MAKIRFFSKTATITPNLPHIVEHADPIMLLGGAYISKQLILDTYRFAPDVIAVDSGANHLIPLKIKPLRVIGDMDSLSLAAQTAFENVTDSVSEQETTDFEKAIARIFAPKIAALGFCGGRLDHQMAVLNVLSRYCDCKIVLLSEDDTVTTVVGTAHFNLQPGDRFAALPLEPTRVRTTGLQWNLNDTLLAPAQTISVSNRVTAGPVRIETERPVIVTAPATRFADIWSAL